jgi:hypothetical protein
MTTFPTETADLARAPQNALARLPPSRVKQALAAEADAVERRYAALTGTARCGHYIRREPLPS